jgi:replicative DNA helicase
LENLYYSSALAFAASQVLMIRPAKTTQEAGEETEEEEDEEKQAKQREQEFTPIVRLALEKNRNGPVGTVKARFLKRLMRFVAED